jgi:hypothetical protein
MLLVEHFFATHIILTGAYDPRKRGQYIRGHIVVTPPIILAFAPLTPPPFSLSSHDGSEDWGEGTQKTFN